jgi:hypothetical protein
MLQDASRRSISLTEKALSRYKCVCVWRPLDPQGDGTDDAPQGFASALNVASPMRKDAVLDIELGLIMWICRL